MIKTSKQTNKALTKMTKRRTRKNNLTRSRNFSVNAQNPQQQPLAITVEAPVANIIPTTLALAETVEAPVENNVTTLVVFDPDMEADDADQIDNQNETKRDCLLQHVNRLLISRYYSEALSSPPSCERNSRGGTFGMINSVFPSLSLNPIKSVVKEAY